MTSRPSPPDDEIRRRLDGQLQRQHVVRHDRHAPPPGMTDGTYTGGAANTRYGPVQVQITVSGGVIADVKVTDYPHSDRRDRRSISARCPILVSETTQAQSSRIDMVSGATYTSQGYIASLQSAIDQANA